MEAVPLARTWAARSCQPSGVPMREPVENSARLRTRSGCATASSNPTAPPNEAPA
jgi:hypothetical protein